MTNKYLNIKNKDLRLNKFSRILLIIYAILEYPFILTYCIFSRQIGMNSHFFSMLVGLKIFLKTGELKCAIPLILSPLDSVRYGEFWFAIKKIKNLKVKNYLDVSSPRLLPLLTYTKSNLVKIDVLNPDQTDLNYTRKIFKYMNVDKRVNFYNHSIDNNIFETKSYDLITCMSVLEHIEEDIRALKRIWSLLKNNGSLILTVPCSKTTINEYTNLDEYKTVKIKSKDYLFWQRFYSQKLLDENIFKITGKPEDFFIYGEIKPGIYNKNVLDKRTNKYYPFWRESLFVFNNFEKKRSFTQLSDLGVIAMIFKKT